MIGIYKFTNKINGKVYIGQSVNLKQRYAGHKSASFNEKAADYNTQFHQAARKYGWENFDYEILVEVSEEEYQKNCKILDDLEKYFIEYYNSYKNGYNATAGGRENFDVEGAKGEKNGRALLTKQDVIYIRECYNNHVRFKTIYEEYKDRISRRGLEKIWRFENWKDIHPEYHNEENKWWHSHEAKANSSEIAANNKRVFSADEVKLYRKEFEENHLTVRQIIKKYNLTQRETTVSNMIHKKTYKDIE